jgi:tetratricopeptide (TPR) repeat protein
MLKNMVLAAITLALVPGMSLPARGQSADDLSKEGTVKIQRGDFDGAIKDFNEAIRLNPNDPTFYILRARAKHFKNDFDGVIKDFDEVIRIEPDMPYAYLYRGNAKIERADIDGAIKDFDVAIRLIPNDPEGYLCRGRAKHMISKRRDLDGSIKDFNEAIRLKHDNPYAYKLRGITKQDKGNLDGAIKDFDEAIRLKSDDPEMYRSRGMAKGLVGDRGSAQSDFAKAAALDPQDAELALWLVGFGGDNKTLEKFAGGKTWISSVVHFYLGRMTRDRLLDDARKGGDASVDGVGVRVIGPGVVEDTLCEAHGFIGLLAEKEGDARLARASYEASVATGAKDNLMYAWAKARLAAISRPDGTK